MRRTKIGLVGGALVLVLSAVALGTATSSKAIIHEMIGASCRVDGFNNPPEPTGQAPGGPSNGNSTLRALQATGVISSIDATPTLVTINFDLSRPNAKFISAGFSLLIPNGAGPGVDLMLNPAPTIDGSTFPAFIHCANLNK
jgi:hypothetical protein